MSTSEAMGRAVSEYSCGCLERLERVDEKGKCDTSEGKESELTSCFRRRQGKIRARLRTHFLARGAECLRLLALVVKHKHNIGRLTLRL